MALPTAGEISNLVPWSGFNQGQTLDSNHSYATTQCDDSHTLFVSGHLYKTNLPNQKFLVYYKLDGSAPILTSSSFTTSADGTGDFAFSVEGMTSGSHAVVVEINLDSNNHTYYINGAAQSNASTGIPFTCP
ncbi:MAG TPA: hypothetical protein VFV38_31875 [Ktedonobacteraceae bacterium]|nr:hypothetical protein [Ktedonobacteraceae bacterium]